MGPGGAFITAGALLAAGWCIGWRCHDVPVLANAITIESHEQRACEFLDAYLTELDKVPDFRLHFTTMGVHRANTISAVNELYDRGHCQVTGAAGEIAPGRPVYRKINSAIYDDQMPAPIAAVSEPQPQVAPPIGAPRQAPAQTFVAIREEKHAPAAAPPLVAPPERQASAGGEVTVWRRRMRIEPVQAPPPPPCEPPTAWEKLWQTRTCPDGQ